MTSLCSEFAVQPNYEPVKSAQMYQECLSSLCDTCRRIYTGYFMLPKNLPMAVSVFLLSTFHTSFGVRFREFHFQIVICSQCQLREIHQYSPVFWTFSLAKRFCESIHILPLSCLAKKKNMVKLIVEACSRFQAFCLESKSPTPADVCVTYCRLNMRFKQRTKPTQPR
jgi:hypothetical protein